MATMPDSHVSSNTACRAKVSLQPSSKQSRPTIPKVNMPKPLPKANVCEENEAGFFNYLKLDKNSERKVDKDHQNRMDKADAAINKARMLQEKWKKDTRKTDKLYTYVHDLERNAALGYTKILPKDHNKMLKQRAFVQESLDHFTTQVEVEEKAYKRADRKEYPLAMIQHKQARAAMKRICRPIRKEIQALDKAIASSDDQ